jgi:hypothetical protein
MAKFDIRRQAHCVLYSRTGTVILLSRGLYRYGTQRYREIAPLFSVPNSKPEFQKYRTLLITKGGVRGEVGSEKHVRNF